VKIEQLGRLGRLEEFYCADRGIGEGIIDRIRVRWEGFIALQKATLELRQWQPR
jgi:hypothetical protein